MARRKAHTPEEIVAKLRQVEVLVGQGKLVAEAVRSIGVTEPSYHYFGTFIRACVGQRTRGIWGIAAG
jgi:putative transposase